MHSEVLSILKLTESPHPTTGSGMFEVSWCERSDFPSSLMLYCLCAHTFIRAAYRGCSLSFLSSWSTLHRNQFKSRKDIHTYIIPHSIWTFPHFQVTHVFNIFQLCHAKPIQRKTLMLSKTAVFTYFAGHVRSSTSIFRRGWSPS